MARKSIKINLNENNGHDKEINKFLDQQESITGTIKLLLLLAIKHTGYKDLRNAIIEEVLEDRKLFDKREMDNEKLLKDKTILIIGANGILELRVIRKLLNLNTEIGLFL